MPNWKSVPYPADNIIGSVDIIGLLYRVHEGWWASTLPSLSKEVLKYTVSDYIHT